MSTEGSSILYNIRAIYRAFVSLLLSTCYPCLAAILVRLLLLFWQLHLGTEPLCTSHWPIAIPVISQAINHNRCPPVRKLISTYFTWPAQKQNRTWPKLASQKSTQTDFLAAIFICASRSRSLYVSVSVVVITIVISTLAYCFYTATLFLLLFCFCCLYCCWSCCSATAV